MATYTKETALYDTGAIANDIANAGTTATSYITRVDATNGIRVHDLNESTDFVQVNSSAISMYRGGTAAANEKVRIEDDEIRVGATTTGHAILDEDGMDVYIGDTSVAHYGDYARVGKDGEANTQISPSEVLISAGNNINALRITPDGNTQTVSLRIAKNDEILNGETLTVSHPTNANSGSDVAYYIKARVAAAGFNYVQDIIHITKGQTKSTTTVTGPIPYQYSATATQVTIKNTGSSTIYLFAIEYNQTTTSPLTEVGGVLALGKYSDVANNIGAVLVVGDGSEETPHTSLEIKKNGDVYINGTQVLPSKPTVHAELVNANINKAYSGNVRVTAPNVSGYQFLCWAQVATDGWVGTVYPSAPMSRTSDMWNALTGASGQTGTGLIHCLALYIPI